MKRLITYFYAFLLVALMTGCSKTDYLNAIPNNSVALVSMDVGKMNGIDNQTLLKALLHVSNLNTSGIDVSAPVYLFESADGNLGLCAKVDDASDLQKTLDNLASKGICQRLKEHRDCQFTLLKNAWAIGFNDDAVLVMGPVTATSYTNLRSQMAKYLRQSEEKGILHSRLYERLDSIDGAMKMVARVDALPEKLIMPFTLGAPASTNPSQIFVSAKMRVEDKCLVIDGRTFSFNAKIDKALKEATQTYRLIQGKYMFTMSKDDVAGLFVNVKGDEFIRLMNENRGFQALLAGVNAAIDMDNIIKSVDGDMCVIMPNGSDKGFRMKMCAQLAHSQWLKDVDYWKQSCPPGSRIRDWNQNAFCFSDGKTSFYFGVSPDKQFYSGGSEEDALMALTQSKNPIPASWQRLIEGQKMVMVMNLEALTDNQQGVGGVSSMLKPLFGEVNSLLYRLSE